MGACLPTDPKDTDLPADTHAPVDSDAPVDTDTACVDYAEIVSQCAALITPGDRADGYESIDATSTALVQDLHDLVAATHEGISYDNLWEAFPLTDVRDDGTLWDIYADPGDGSPAYSYTLVEDQCGEYDGEGDCYNREHLWAQNWTSGGAPMKSDLHHVFPTDGWVNNIRGDLAFGPVGRIEETTTNGSLRGRAALCDFDDEVFEPVDAYKGDVARAILYMHVRYHGEDSGWNSSDGTTKSEIEPWFASVLLAWHISDPVSEKERTRNGAVEGVQGNRNPFVDHPEYACNAM